MTLSEEKRTELWDKLESYADTHNYVRSDIATLLKFRDSDDAYNPLYLFWNLYQPEVKGDDGNFLSAPDLFSEDEQLVLDALDVLRYRYRVSYEPDADVSYLKKFFSEYAANPDSTRLPDTLKSLLILIHIAAAKAFRMLQSENGYSEEARECLVEVERSYSQLCYLGFEPSMCMPEDYDTGRFECVAVFKSALQVTGLSFVELARMHNLDGRHSNSLHYFAQAQDLYSYALPTPMGIEIRWPLGPDFDWSIVSNELNSDNSWTWTGLGASLNELTITFQSIKDTANSISDWIQIANDCRKMTLSEVWRFDGFSLDCDESFWEISDSLNEQIANLRIEDGTGYRLTWGEFWESARTWASTQLSPSEYRKLREEDGRYAAENRLKNYFFRNTWKTLPSQAQKRLITADVNWNSNQRMHREAILNDLLRATEAMCYELIRNPVTNWFNQYKSTSSLETLDADWKRQKEFADVLKVASPGMRQYIKICEHSLFSQFLNEHGFSKGTIRLITEDLPSAMRQLTDRRNTAEHDTGASTPSEVIESVYQLFLGIGRPGVLPKIAEIGQALQPALTQCRPRQ